jgi:subtilisin
MNFVRGNNFRRFMFMNRKIALSLMVLCALSVFSIGFAQTIPSKVIPGQYIVVLKDNIANPEGVAQDFTKLYGTTKGFVYDYALKGFSAKIPADKLANIVSDPRIRFVEPDLIIHALPFDIATKGGNGNGNNQGGSSQPPQTLPTGVNRIDADLSPTANINGVDDRVDADIAIIDTGVSKTHPDLNFYQGITLSGSGKSGGDDDNGHGSHCAGIAAAKDNTIGVVGVAPGARIWSVKVLNAAGSGTLSGIIAGINYVTQHANQIDVANMSLGGTGVSNSYRLAITNSVNAGIFYAVAAGNEHDDVYGADGYFPSNDDYIPAAYPEVATVSAIADYNGLPGGGGGSSSYGVDDTFATFSNFSYNVVGGNPVNSSGAAIDVAAPGVYIYSTWKGTGYNTISGTSMASPHLAGAAALYIATHGKPSNASDVAAVRQAIINAAIANSFTGDPDGNHEKLLNVATF